MKTAASKSKKPQPSEILFDEAKKMEDKLKQIRQARQKQEEKKKALPVYKDGSHWRSSIKKKGVSNYSTKVLDQQLKANKTKTNQKFIPKENLVQAMKSSASNPPTLPNQKAASNINQALTQQKAQQDFSEVDNFLDSIKLKEKYRYLFIDNGIEELETILELDDSHLQTMKIPLGHKLKILKRIREINSDSNSKPQNPSNNSQASSTSTNIPRKSALKSTGVTAHHSQLQELQPPPLQARSINSIQTSQTSTIISQKGGSLLRGQYNQSESHQSFMQALKQWRTGQPIPETQKSTNQGTTTKKEVRFNEHKIEQDANPVNKTPPSMQNYHYTQQKIQIGGDGKTGSFFANIGDSQNWNVNCLPQHQSVGTQGEVKKEKSDKQSCWQCYKLYSKEIAFKKYNKVRKHTRLKYTCQSFCSQECFNKYVNANQIKCQNSFGECKSQFLKINGELKQGNWYCSSKCAIQAVDALDTVEQNQFGNWEGDKELPNYQTEQYPEIEV